MVKVSITLPNNAQITFESEEPEVIHQIVEMALRDLPRDLMLASIPTNGSAEHSVLSEKGTGTTAPTPSPANTTSVTRAPSLPSLRDTTTASTPVEAEQAFTQFCQSVNPIGDMRRVVVAIEGASRFLSLDSVDAQGLGRLFDLAGWRRPPDFVQTLRNAARSKFRWLERIPGHSGHYTVTDLGRSTILGS
jgi:hypothetical protein